MKNNRLLKSIVTSAILGIFCIVGISFRLGVAGNELFILATYVNRITLGIVIGLITQKFKFKGAILGFIISGAFYLATAFKDTPGFFAGIIYGIIIEYVANKNAKNHK